MTNDKLQVETLESPEKSFIGFELLKFIKGRRRSIIVAISTLLGHFIVDNALAGTLAGIIFESCFGLAEFYLNKIYKKN